MLRSPSIDVRLSAWTWYAVVSQGQLTGFMIEAITITLIWSNTLLALRNSPANQSATASPYGRGQLSQPKSW